MSVKGRQTRGVKWQSGDLEEGSRDIFLRYAGGNTPYKVAHENIQSEQVESRKRYVTEVSHISQGDGFKKARVNQLDTLRELRQEYEILRGLPIQDEFLRHSHAQRQPSETASRDSISSSFQSSKRDDKKSTRNTQILTLQKRQLQLVIGNSMRKVEELLNNQMQYKKIIHELQLQLDSRNLQDKTESLTKALKRNETQSNQRNENLKKEIERLKQNNRMSQERYDTLNSELQQRITQIKKLKEEKRSLEQQIRLQKDKLLSIQIDMKRIRMQSQVFAKDRNIQVARLTGLLELQPQNPLQKNQISRLENELKISKQKYDSLFNDFEKFKRHSISKQKQLQNQKKSQGDQVKLFETLINHMREDSANQKRASMDLVASMIAKIQGKQSNNQENSQVLDELSNLRNDLSTIKRDREGNDNPLIGLVQSAADFNAKIRILQRQIADGTVTKQNLTKEYQTIRSSYEYTKFEYEKLNTENQRLKRLLQNQNSQISDQDSRLFKRKMEEAQFEIQKARKQGQFNLGLAKAETQSRFHILEGELKRSEQNNTNLRQQLDKMRSYYQSKIAEKNLLLDKISSQFSIFKVTREQSFQQIRNQSELKLSQMTKRIAQLAELSQRSINESSRVSILEQELSRLRQSSIRSKSMSDNVDHLWQIKETEYHNIHQLISEIQVSQ